MPVERIHEAFSLLDGNHADIVFGPSEDGGYYLLAMKGMHPELFQDIPWSSQETLAANLDKAKSLGLHSVLIPPCFDLDRIEDLVRLSKSSDGTSAPRTISRLLQMLPI
jgi:glycosyltransferase A (GT-A) superfamily protein (DUF2064 family)